MNDTTLAAINERLTAHCVAQASYSSTDKYMRACALAADVPSLLAEIDRLREMTKWDIINTRFVEDDSSEELVFDD